jgi:hypothetical protein
VKYLKPIDQYQPNEYYIINYFLHQSNNSTFINEASLKKKYKCAGIPDAIIGNIIFQITRASSSEHLIYLVKEKIIKSLSFLLKSSYNCEKFIIAVWIPSNDIISDELIELWTMIISKINIFEIVFFVPNDEMNEMLNVFPKKFMFRNEKDYNVEEYIENYYKYRDVDILEGGLF